MTPIKPLNRTCAFEHTGHYGTKLEAKTMDLMTKNVITRPLNVTDAQFAADISEIIDFWKEHIQPAFMMDGEGWRGFAQVRYVVQIPQDECQDDILQVLSQLRDQGQAIHVRRNELLDRLPGTDDDTIRAIRDNAGEVAAVMRLRTIYPPSASLDSVRKHVLGL